MANEIAQQKALALGGRGPEGASSIVKAHQANAALERAVHKVIELGRGLAERPSEEPTKAPETLLN